MSAAEETLQYPESWQSMRTLLCHDWLTGMRGGERVLEILCRGFPDAPVYTLIHNRAAISETINAHPVNTSFLQNIPNVYKHYRHMLPLFPYAVSRFRPQPAELVISTSHCVAKSFIPPPGARHLCYCFTPMRYAWTFYNEYFGNNPLKALLAKPLLAALRRWDRKTASRVHCFVAISRHVQQRIEKFYKRESLMVYPPVDTGWFTPGEESHDGYDLVISAMVPYKRVDLAVKAYSQSGFPLKVVGVGSEHPRLRALAGPNVSFAEWLPDEQTRELYRRCRFLIFPGEEDFGIVPLEAQACGKPVIAFGRGGALETIRDGETGVFFPEQTETALNNAVQQAQAVKWNRRTIRRHAEDFSIQNFIDGIGAAVNRCMEMPVKQ